MPAGHPWGNSWGHPLGGHVLRISLGGRLISGSESSLESSASTAAATCGACVNHMLLQSGGQFMTNYLNRAHQRMPNLGLRKGGGLQGHLLSNRWGGTIHDKLPQQGTPEDAKAWVAQRRKPSRSVAWQSRQVARPKSHVITVCGANNSCHITSTHSGRSTGGCKSDLRQGSPFGLRPLGCAKAEACSTSRAVFAASRASSASRSA